MISLLSGTIHSKTPDTLTLLTPGGVGYAVRVSPVFAAESAVGSECSLYTYLKVSDSALDLYGFTSVPDRTFFELLLTVKGVGPKSAMNILSLGSMHDIQDAIARGDAKYLSSVQGLGKKTAERLCVELKSKVQITTLKHAAGNAQDGNVLADVVDALVGLGYTAEDAREAVKQLDTAEKTVEQLIREALQMMQ